MGIFKKREYTLSEALKIMNEKKKVGYDLVPINADDINTKYWIEQTEKVKKRIDALKPQIKIHESQKDFRNRINGNGTYQNMLKVPRYNDYQASRGYQRNNGEMYR